MDQPSPEPDLLAQSLTDLAWVNRFLGGTASLIHQLRQLLVGYQETHLRVLDVGAGGGDVLLSVGGWLAGRGARGAGEARGMRLRGVALDFGQQAVRFAAREFEREGRRADPDKKLDLYVVLGDGRALPFADRAFDVAISTTFLHHLESEDAVQTLIEMARVSRWGLVASDLRRTVMGHLVTSVIARTVWRRHEYARHDGPASMRAAYSLREAAALAERAGLEAAVQAQPGFRWALRWRRPA
ncbi:MAG: methyltransferase domain-containing protein [Gemmatimonadota bacterium]